MNQSQPPVPSLHSLVSASLVAVLIAASALVFFVLPAEYGIDPTGVGSELGLTALAPNASEPAQAAAIPLQAGLSDETPCPDSETAEASSWQDSVKIIIPAGKGLEYKFHLAKDAAMEYAWATDGAKLYFDFHGEPAGDTSGYFKSFKESTGNRSEGSLTAPFTGSHGWYWENNGAAAVTVILHTRGDYRILGLM